MSRAQEIHCSKYLPVLTDPPSCFLLPFALQLYEIYEITTFLGRTRSSAPAIPAIKGPSASSTALASCMTPADCRVRS